MGANPDTAPYGLYFFWTLKSGEVVMYQYFIRGTIDGLTFDSERMFHDYADGGNGLYGGYYFNQSLRPSLTDKVHIFP